MVVYTCRRRHVALRIQTLCHQLLLEYVFRLVYGSRFIAGVTKRLCMSMTTAIHSVNVKDKLDVSFF